MSSWLIQTFSNFSFGIRDAIDIIIVAFLFYRTFMVIKGTLAVQMIAGITILLIATWLSELAGMYTIYWILQHFWTLWVIAMVVLFQPELRRALAHVGRHGFVTKHRATEWDMIQAIVSAAHDLSEKRTGALVVIEGEIGLRTYREGGVQIDSRVSSDLIRSIFHTGTPLHDGAIILEHGRVAAAACFLPLSKNQNLSRTLGTRHRAALGISEESDAVAVVVSEETGAISLAYNGQLERIGTPADLQQRLTEIFAAESAKRKRT